MLNTDVTCSKSKNREKIAIKFECYEIDGPGKNGPIPGYNESSFDQVSHSSDLPSNGLANNRNLFQ